MTDELSEQNEVDLQVALNKDTRRLIRLSELYLQARASVRDYLMQTGSGLDNNTMAQALVVQEIIRLHEQKPTMSEEAIERKRSHWRGHPIVYENDQWWYEDTMEPIPAQNGKVRSCGKCGSTKWSGDGEVDECLGVLPGVMNACCGHGVRDESYIQFTNGVAIRGFTIDTNREESDD